MILGPRIYNLFPLLVGSVQDWSGHLARIAGMQFDWVFLNPFHYPGFSGSLYAVKDPYRLNDRVPGRASESPDDLMPAASAAGRQQHGMRVMMDLVVNHTAKDAVLAAQHPEWFRREADGSALQPARGRSGRSQQGDDLGRSGRTRLRESGSPRPVWSITGRRYVQHYVGLGFGGFRCDAAYQVPAAVWRELIDAAHDVDPEVVFCAGNAGLHARAGRCAGATPGSTTCSTAPNGGISRALAAGPVRAVPPHRAVDRLPREPRHRAAGRRVSAARTASG